MPTTGSLALTAGTWYPILIGHTQAYGGEQMTVNYKNTTNQTSYTTMTHSTAATGIQMAYDNDEVIPSRTGTLFVDGTLTVMSPNTYFTGNIYSNNNILASQSWVQGQNYLTTSPSSLTEGILMGNPIVSYANSNCYIQCLSATGNNWIEFHANNTTTDAQILCTAGTSGSSNTGNLNFYCANSVFNCPLTCTGVMMGLCNTHGGTISSG